MSSSEALSPQEPRQDESCALQDAEANSSLNGINGDAKQSDSPSFSDVRKSARSGSSGSHLNDLAHFDETRPLNSPRSLEICRRCGILPVDISKKRMQDYLEIGITKENLKIKFEFMEEKRKLKLQMLQQLYEQMLRDEQLTDQSRVSKLESQQQELHQKRQALDEHLARERDALRRLQEKQKEELAKAILHEMEAARMADEIEDRIQQKETERKQRQMEQRAEMNARFVEQRRLVQQRIECAVQAQKRLEEEQVQIWAQKQERMKEMRKHFEEIRLQQLEDNHKKAAAKQDCIKQAQQRLQQIEDEKIKVALDKQQRAEMRMQEQERIRLEREQLKREQEAEKERLRESKIQKMKEDDQRRVQVLEQRNRQADETLSKIMGEKRAQIERKAQIARLKAAEKIDFLQRLNRVNDVRQEEALGRIDEYNLRIDRLHAEKEKILDERRRLHSEEAVQRQKFREYIANMRKTKLFKPPSWMHLDLSEYENRIRSRSSQERPSSSVQTACPNSERSHHSDSRLSNRSQHTRESPPSQDSHNENPISAEHTENQDPPLPAVASSSPKKIADHPRRKLKIDSRFRDNPLAQPLQHTTRPGVLRPPSPPRLVFTNQQ